MKKTTKMFISLALSVMMICALCLPSFAQSQATTSQQVRYSFSAGNNIQHTIATYSSHTGSTVGSIWGSYVVDRYDTSYPVYYGRLNMYAYIQAYAADGTIIDDVESYQEKVLFDYYTWLVTDSIIMNESDDFIYMFAIYETEQWVSDDPNQCVDIFRYTPTYFERDLLTDSYVDDF